MAKRIGEALIEKGLIAPAQLETALKNQLILGGHLGTCLLELEFVDEEQLGKVLTEVLGVPYASPAMLRRIPESVIRALPKRLVAEYRAVPIGFKDSTLHVAMMDPRDLRALDVLAFGSGYKIAAWIAPEVRIVEAMERHYDIPRSVRYIAIARAVSRLTEASGETPPSTSTPFGETYISGTNKDADLGNFDAEYGYGRSWVEIADELCGPEGSQPASPAASLVPPRTSPQSAPPACTLSEVAGRLCAADDKDEIARAILDYASRTMPRCLLFAVRNGEASIWSGAGFPGAASGAASPRFPIHGAGIFHLLLGNEHYLGPLADDPRHKTFYRALGAEPPAEIFLAPVHLSDRLVALVLGDGGPGGRITGDARDPLKLVSMLALSLSLLVLKKKIRDVGSFAPADARPGSGAAGSPQPSAAAGAPPPAAKSAVSRG